MLSFPCLLLFRDEIPINNAAIYTTQSLISIKTLFVSTGHTCNLTRNFAIHIKQNHHCANIPSFLALPTSAFHRLAETMETP